MDAVGYVRVSTEEQAREGYSLAAQEQAIRAYAQAQGWEVDNVYQDAGYSGSRRDRPALVECLGRAATISGVVVIWRLDRLSRSLGDLIEICKAHPVASVTEHFDTSTAAGEMTMHMLGMVAQFERRTIAERITMGLAERRRQGLHNGRTPLGYKSVDGRLVVDPATVGLVQALFSMYAAGAYSFRQLAQHTALLGHALTPMAIRKILANPVYTGQAGGAPAMHEALIAPDLWERTQLVRMKRGLPHHAPRPYGRTPYPLTGILICGHCGQRMIGVQSGTKQTRYYRCYHTLLRGRQACPQKMVRAELIEGLVVTLLTLKVRDLEGAADRALVLAQTPRPDVQSLHRRIKRWQVLYAEMGEISEAEYREKVAPLKAELATVDVGPVVDRDEVLRRLRQIPTLYERATPTRKRELIQAAFKEIVVRDSDIVRYTMRQEIGVVATT